MFNWILFGFNFIYPTDVWYCEYHFLNMKFLNRDLFTLKCSIPIVVRRCFDLLQHCNHWYFTYEIKINEIPDVCDLCKRFNHESDAKRLRNKNRIVKIVMFNVGMSRVKIISIRIHINVPINMCTYMHTCTYLHTFI